MKGGWVLREKVGGEEISTQENLKKGDDMGTGDCGFGFDSAESQAIRSGKNFLELRSTV